MSNQWNQRFGLGERLRFVESHGGLIAGIVDTERCTGRVYLQGAHVTEFQPRQMDAPVLFMSSQALFAQGKAIRGGVPICFPWFGAHPDDPSQPAHGLARTSPWDLLETHEEHGNIVLRFGLVLPPFDLGFRVMFGDTLEYFMEVTNRSSSNQSFELALHTYLQLGAVDQVTIRGLEELSFLDQLSGVWHPASGSPIRFHEETDRIYQGMAGRIAIEDRAYGRMTTIESTGSKSTIVWNPWIAKSRRMADFGDEEYLKMCCVETANVRQQRVEIEPEAVHRTTVRLSVQSLETTAR